MRAQIREIRRRQVVDQDVINAIRDLCDKAERGEITEICVVANDVTGAAHHRASSFENTWTMLGALEYAKAGVLKSITEK